ncbi:hypothetical protein PV10_02204 [Exophiala mesophila]|uniref:Uncharacterized protein n=1 Tax=Exophiala mesophila TaxID=212818 RepID=A0A0D1ZIP2_EXOME|nr:uncharacterized protein PV10_02204 [Exophiala mesophila]KIV94437.1 hypothetical protein PV10_02204 [Exophiala mesophila]
MTRRKRTPSPSAAQKRVAFEIPASLQQFSSISRSLATNIATPDNTGHPGPLNASHPLPTKPSTPAAATKPSSRPVTHSQKFTQTSQRPSSVGREAWINQSATKPANVSSASTKSQTSATQASRTTPRHSSTPTRADSTSTQRQASSNPTSTTASAMEPELKDGEAPTLKTHPNLIAALIAAKRAENEAIGNRERWARQQSEYRATKSPSAQPSIESHVENVQKPPAQPQQRAISNPLPARPTKTTPNARRTTQQTTSKPPIICTTKMPSNLTATPNTQDPEASAAIFESPFSTPIAEFLERATDEMGPGRDSLGLNSPSTSAHMDTNKPNPPPAPRSSSQQPQHHVVVPPLFSDKSTVQNPHPQQPHSSNQNHQQFQQTSTSSTIPQYGRVPAPMMQSMPLSQTTTNLQTHTSMQHGLSMAQPYPNDVQLQQHQQHQPQTRPYYPLPRGQQGFHKIDLRPQFNINRMQQSDNSRMSQDQVAATSSSFDPSVGMNSPHIMQTAMMSNTNAHLPNIIPYSRMMPSTPRVAMPFPLPDQIPTYGNPEIRAPPRPTPPPQLGTPSGFMTAADMVAGINTRFKIATPNGFSVPKRH